MDKYVQAFIKVNIRIDAGNRVFCKDEELEVHVIGGVRKIVLPKNISKLTYTFEQLRAAGAQCDAMTVKTLALTGAEARWKDEIQERRKIGLPSNVYVANARTIEKALAEGKSPPQVRYVGRKKDQITEVRDTVDEVIRDLAAGDFRTDFARGRHARSTAQRLEAKKIRESKRGV
jgi:hypothetical protein